MLPLIFLLPLLSDITLKLAGTYGSVGIIESLVFYPYVLDRFVFAAGDGLYFLAVPFLTVLLKSIGIIIFVSGVNENKPAIFEPINVDRELAGYCACYAPTPPAYNIISHTTKINKSFNTATGK